MGLLAPAILFHWIAQRLLVATAVAAGYHTIPYHTLFVWFVSITIDVEVVVHAHQLPFWLPPADRHVGLIRPRV